MKPIAVHIPHCFGQCRWLTFALEPDDDKSIGHSVGYNASKNYVPFNQFKWKISGELSLKAAHLAKGHLA